MVYSRLIRHEERIQRKRLIVALGGMIGLIIFLFMFGLKILVGFSIFVDRMRGNPPQQPQTRELILPPTLDILPQATNSASVALTGKGDPGRTIALYIDDEEPVTLTVQNDGTFSLVKRLSEGAHTVSAKAKNDKETESVLSNVIRVTIMRQKPELTIASPAYGSRIVGEANTIAVKGKTGPDNMVIVNDRTAVVASDGSFSYTLALSEGDTTIRITATDPAGNQTTLERRVTYQK